MTKKNVYMLVNTNDRLAKKSDPAQDAVKLYNCATFDIIADLVFGESLGLLGNAELSSGVEAIFGNMKMISFLGATVGYLFLRSLVKFLSLKSMQATRMHCE